MALNQLTPEQVRTWTLEQKDEWWLKNIYRGDMPQLTWKSALTGMLLGGVLSLTNLYVGIRTGWTLGVGISSVILSFALFRAMEQLRIGKDMTILENNAMQSIATSAGYMTAPLISALPAYMLVTGQIIPMWVTLVWICLLSILGVLYAFPLKKRFINDEQLPFPEGYAAGVVLHNLHEGGGQDGILKAKILGAGAGVAALLETWRSEGAMKFFRLTFMQLPEHWDDFLYNDFFMKLWGVPRVLGIPLKDLTVQFETSIILVGAGGIMGIRTGFSLLIGGVLNYLILAPIMINNGVIVGTGFKNISMWSLWGGVAMMTTSSLYSFFAKPEVFVAAFKKLGKKGEPKKVDILKDIELPLWVSFVGIPIVGLATVLLGHHFFNFGIGAGLFAIPLVFVFTLIAVTSTGLTSITPGGALGKLTQLTYAVISPGNIPTNIMAAGINSEVSLNASNLLMDIKPGYMLGAKPRQQAIGHILGIFAGAAVATPVYYLLFHGDISLFTSEKMPMPSVVIWKAVAEVLSKGLNVLHPTAQIAVLVGAALGIVLEFLKQKTHGKFPLTAMGLGLAFVLKFTDCLAMGLGSVLIWWAHRKYTDVKTTQHKIFVANAETLCAGIIAGGSIIGIVLVLIETLAG